MKKKERRGRRRLTLLMVALLLISQICATNVVVLAHEENPVASNYSEENTTENIDDESGEESEKESEEESEEESGEESSEESKDESGEESSEESKDESGEESGEEFKDESSEESSEESKDEPGEESNEEFKDESSEESNGDSSDDTGENVDEDAADVLDEEVDVKTKKIAIKAAVFSMNDISEKTSISGSTTWNDADDVDGKRPASITIRLYANGKEVQSKAVTDKDNWTFKFDDLDKYSGDEEIEYTITEDEVEYYTTEIIGTRVINTHIPEKTIVKGSKTWVADKNGQEAIPESISIRLYAGTEEVANKVVAAEDGWSWKFENLDKFKDGQEIVYSIKEDPVADYSTEYNGYDVINTYTPDYTQMSVVKVWDDNDDQDGIRPESVKVRLYDGLFPKGDAVELNKENNWSYTWSNLPDKRFGFKINYSVKEVGEVDGYEPKIVNDGTLTTITNVHVPEKTNISGSKTWNDANNQDGKRPASITVRLYADGKEVQSKAVTDKDNWTFKFDDLDKYSGGEEIKYTITEDEVKYYTTEIIGTRVINTHIPEKTIVKGSKTWVADKNGQEAIPESISIRLYAGTEEVANKVVTAEDGWSWKFENLDKFKDGKEIVYSIKEDPVADYSTEYNGYDVINTYTPDYTQMSVVKVWDDNNNQDGIRPESVKVRLYDGLFPKGDAVELNKENNWSYTWRNLPDRRFGFKVNYSVKEVGKVDGYEPKIVNDGTLTTITNVHVPEKTSVSGSKTWDDADDQDGKRPASITIRLYANGKEVQSKVVTKQDDWSWRFNDLPKYEAGAKIIYTLTEDAVEGYSTSVDGYNLTNKYTPTLTSRTVYKVWNDAENKDKLRPGTIRVQLYANGEAYGDEVTLNAENNWSYTWKNLDEMSKGKVITYTVSELGNISGYTTTYSEDTFVITNTHTPKPPKKPTSDDKHKPTPEGNGSTPEETLMNNTEQTANEQAVVPTLVDSTNGEASVRGNNPKTGEDNTMFVLSILGIVMCLGVIIFTGKRKRQRKDLNK